ncbi:MAG: DUF4416 family protein [Sphaerochaetaceae bacterium]|nr:DUF4416 family protein [Sphaerochaetaceae bacterium]
MAQARQFEKTALIIGILSAMEEERPRLMKMLEEAFGPVKAATPVMDFPFTDYYDSEMGGHPVRYILLFERLIDPSTLSAVKTRTNEMEKLFTGKGTGRPINIDPGTLSLANLILATCKDRAHRIPLSDGIYGEVTLIYQNGDFQALPWTYADYSSDEVRMHLRVFRSQYRLMLRDLVLDNKDKNN